MPALLSNPAIRSIVLDGPAPVDLVNTHLYLDETWIDLLDDPEQRIEWLAAEAERLGISVTGRSLVSDEVAEAIRAVRAHALAAIEPARHGRRPPARALAALNEALRAAPALPHARWEGSAVVATAERSGPLSVRLAAGFAEAAVELLAGPSIRDVRRCDAPSCVVLFLPRNPNRRWCTPTICGNRARVARYYLRHRSEQVS